MTLVNLVSESRAIPECLGRDCTADQIAASLKALRDSAAARVAQRQAMELAMTRLGQGGDAPGLRAAASVLRFMERRAR